jgi:hypothetical protein
VFYSALNVGLPNPRFLGIWSKVKVEVVFDVQLLTFDAPPL